MSCCISDLRDKEIINICNGARLGYVVDVEVDVSSGGVISLVASGNVVRCSERLKRSSFHGSAWSG